MKITKKKDIHMKFCVQVGIYYFANLFDNTVKFIHESELYTIQVNIQA